MDGRDDLVEVIRRDARRADALQRQSRDLLVDAVHRAAEAGLSQREISRIVHRSQPEVSRLLHQERPRLLALRIRENRQSVMDVLEKYGVTDARIFGSVATGTETVESDVDLLIDTTHVLGLGALSRLEHELASLLDVEVDVVPERGLAPHLRDRVLSEAVPL